MNEEKTLAQRLKEYVENLEIAVKGQNETIEELRLIIGHNEEREKQLRADLDFLRKKHEELKAVYEDTELRLSRYITNDA